MGIDTLNADFRDAMECAAQAGGSTYWAREAAAYTLDTAGTNPSGFDFWTPDRYDC